MYMVGLIQNRICHMVVNHIIYNQILRNYLVLFIPNLFQNIVVHFTRDHLTTQAEQLIAIQSKIISNTVIHTCWYISLN